MYQIRQVINKDQSVDTDILSILENGKKYAIPLDPANTDYANFKLEINEGKSQLQDADGKLMSADAAKAFVATLP